MFAGLRVLELASVLAGPSVGQFFAELGAEVIKIENPRTGGDVTRTWKSAGEQTDDRSAYFCSCNWGKKSVCLDLTRAEDVEVVKKLSMQSDVVIASYKPGDAEKLGVSYHELKKVNHSIIYGQITGYGPDDDRVGYDAVIQAEAGFMELNGDKDGPPTKMPVALVDVLVAHQLKEGLLLALLHQERTGEGAFIEVSLLQAAVASLVNQGTNWLVGHHLPQRQGSAHPNIAPYGESFITADGKRFLLAVGTDRQFDDLLHVLSLERQPQFTTNASRVQHREELSVFLSQAISTWPSPELMRRLHEKKIPAGFIHTMPEVFELNPAKALLLQDDGLTAVRHVALQSHPVFTRATISAPPHLGEHTAEILKSVR